MFDFPQPGVGNSGALCEVVRSLRPKTAPFFADPWQQICGNDIVSCWVITHNSDCHILQSLGKKWRGEKKKNYTEVLEENDRRNVFNLKSYIEKKFTPAGQCSGNNCFIPLLSDWCGTGWQLLSVMGTGWFTIPGHFGFLLKMFFFCFFLMIIAFSLGLLKQVWLFNKSCGFKWLKPFEPI